MAPDQLAQWGLSTLGTFDTATVELAFLRPHITKTRTRVHNSHVTDLGLSLATAAVKIACKIWLGDHSIAADAGLDLADILRSKIANDRNRRRVQRQFDQLEETVADRITTALAHEFRGLNEGERTAAILLAHDTLQGASLTDKDLFNSDLDPLYLEKHVRETFPAATRDLSEVATALYDRLMAECCTDIVEIISALPTFGPAAFTEILRRETKLIGMVRDLLDRVPARIVTGLRSTADAEFAAAYRAQVVNRLDRLRLFGVTQTTLRYPLSVAYVSLNISSGSVSPRSRQGDSVWSGRGEPHTSASSPVRIEELLDRTGRLLIRGEAGSGKTTLLQWLAVRSARYDFSDDLAQWNALVPFYIQLRNYTDRELPEPAYFVKQLGSHLTDTMPHGWVTALLEQGLALILIDGVDELPLSQRSATRRWLLNLVDDFPKAKYIVTSRPAAIGEDWLESAQFLASNLEPMSPPDVSIFVSKWHDAVRSEVVDFAELDELRRCEDKMQASLLEERRLRQLATNPLMCALLCALHHDRKSELPRDRIEIYDAALEMLLERRDFERGVIGNIPAFSRRRKLYVLQTLAYWLMRNGWSSGLRDLALVQVRNCLTTMPEMGADPDPVLQNLLERSGVLREPSAGRIDFAHRTFQEYLAARAIIEAGDVGLLLQNASDDLWQEVVVLGVGYAGSAIREQLLGELLKHAREASSDKRARLHLVALACLEVAPQIPVESRKNIEQEAAKLLPPTTMAQAEAIAKAGEFGLELLMRRSPSTARQTAATIRAASLVGGEVGLGLIKTHSIRSGSTVGRELVRAWSRFDLQVYAREVLAGIKLWELTINDPQMLSALRHIHAQCVSVEFTSGHGDISALAQLSGLRYLTIRDRRLTDLTPLQNCGDLESLELWQTGRFSLRDLCGCHSLRRLDFNYRDAVDTETLRLMPHLTSLQLLGVTTYSAMKHSLPQTCRLDRFGLWDAHDMTDLTEMLADRRFEDLHFLLLGDCRSLSSISGISSWSKCLSGIYLHAPDLHDWHELGRLTELDFANLYRMPIDDLSFAAGLRKLRILHIGGGAKPIPDLGPLRDLPELSLLFLYGKGRIDLSPLKGMTDLTIRITDLNHRDIRGVQQLGRRSKVQTL